MFGSFGEAIKICEFRAERLRAEMDTCPERIRQEYVIRLHEVQEIQRGLLAAMEYEMLLFENDNAPRDEQGSLLKDKLN